ncbi:MAG: 4'-phosphopantetheinyl transferase family protein [Lachnospiraceae bacterium]
MIFVIYTKYTFLEGEHRYHKEHNLGRKLLRYGLEKYYGLAFQEEELEDQIGKNEYGKPFLIGYPKIHFNISHCEGWVLCAFSEGKIGVDVERIRDFPTSMVKKILTEQERQILNRYEKNVEDYQKIFYRFWTWKESYLKWLGEGFYMDPLRVEFTMDEVTSFPCCSDKKVALFEKMIDTDCVFSVCFDKEEKGDMIYELYKEKVASLSS